MNLLDVLKPGEEGRQWIASELFRRAAGLYEQANLLREAADCWIEAGNAERAIKLYFRQFDHARAARLLFAEGRYAEALDCYRRWLASLSSNDPLQRVIAHLGIAACLTRMETEPEEAQRAYRNARQFIESAEADRHNISAAFGHRLVFIGRCWEALGEHGAMVERNDLIQLGYERALAIYGESSIYHQDQLRAARAYLAALKDNKSLAAEIEERLAEWI